MVLLHFLKKCCDEGKMSIFYNLEKMWSRHEFPMICVCIWMAYVFLSSKNKI